MHAITTPAAARPTVRPSVGPEPLIDDDLFNAVFHDYLDPGATEVAICVANSITLDRLLQITRSSRFQNALNTLDTLHEERRPRLDRALRRHALARLNNLATLAVNSAADAESARKSIALLLKQSPEAPRLAEPGLPEHDATVPTPPPPPDVDGSDARPTQRSSPIPARRRADAAEKTPTLTPPWPSRATCPGIQCAVSSISAALIKIGMSSIKRRSTPPSRTGPAREPLSCLIPSPMLANG